ncbi:MAG: sigma-70 family RNA polymerase sigma factor [Synechococcaceae cyanobacterium]
MRCHTPLPSLPIPLAAKRLHSPGPSGPRQARVIPGGASGSPASGQASDDLKGRNLRWLEAYDRCRHTPEAISLRNRLVEHNLPLVVRVAASLQHHDGLPFEDMVQVGSLGLIRAIESWDGRRGSCLSSFAVPYIRGAIQREIRDRLALLRVPRPLWDLRQRASAIQEQRRRQNRPALSQPQLAVALACSPEQLEESQGLAQRATPCSLDAPLMGAESGGASCLLELIADPASQRNRDGDGESSDSPKAEHLWLRQQLLRLDPAARALLEGRFLEGCSWPELARRTGVSQATARRRLQVLLRRLREAAQAWRGREPALVPWLQAG